MTIDMANRLVRLRREKGLSQEELAAQVGVSRQAVSKWERAEASPDTENWILLARLYGVSLDELLLGKGQETKAEETAVSPEEPESASGMGREEADGGASRSDEPDETGGTGDGAASTAKQAAERPASLLEIGEDGIRIEEGDERVYIGPDRILSEDGEERVSIEGGRILVEENGETLWDSADPPASRWQSFPYPVLVTLVFLALGFFGGWWHPGWLVFLTIPPYYMIANAIAYKKPWEDAVYPMLTVIVYLLLGFIGGWWHPGWLVFLTIPLYYSVVDVVTRKKSWKHFAYPVLVTLVFLALGSLGGWWHPGWLVFLTIPLYYSLFPEKS